MRGNAKTIAWTVWLRQGTGRRHSALVNNFKIEDSASFFQKKKLTVTQTVPSRVLAGTKWSAHSHRPDRVQRAPGQTASHWTSSTQPESPGFTSVLERNRKMLFYSICKLGQQKEAIGT
jgi:hypothetical protein